MMCAIHTKLILQSSSSQTFLAGDALKLCNIVAGTPFFSPPVIRKFSSCYDGYTIVVKAATLRIVQSV
jgi:hypothetical protein